MCQRHDCAVVMVLMVVVMMMHGQIFLKLRWEARLTHSMPEIILSY